MKIDALKKYIGEKCTVFVAFSNVMTNNSSSRIYIGTILSIDENFLEMEVRDRLVTFNLFFVVCIEKTNSSKMMEEFGHYLIGN